MDKLFELIEDNKEELKDQLYKDLIETYGEALKETSYARIWIFTALDDGPNILKGPLSFTDYDLGCKVINEFYPWITFSIRRHAVPKDSQAYAYPVKNSVLARTRLKELEEGIQARTDRCRKKTIAELKELLKANHAPIPIKINGRRVKKADLVDFVVDSLIPI